MSARGPDLVLARADVDVGAIWSAEAEQAVLGGLMTFPESAEPIRAIGLCREDFLDEAHRAIWRAIAAVQAQGVEPEPVSVLEALRSARADALAGGVDYLAQLCDSAISARHSAALAAIVRDKAHRRRLDDTGRAIQQAAGGALDAAALRARVEALADDLLRHGAPTGTGRAVVVDLAGTAAAAAKGQTWAVEGYVPCGVVTLLAAHGGTGKSLLALMLSVSTVLGRDWLGVPTRQATVVFYSAEDPQDVVLRRLHRICKAMEINPLELVGRLLLLDATEGDPVLYTIQRSEGINHGVATRAHAELADYIRQHDVGLVIVDNASDVFDGDEINRSHVRGFLRQLVRLVRDQDGAVLLLAHVDKTTSRAGKLPMSGETYSGSTAWHNSVRSRLFLLECEPGQLELRHEKSNLGRKREPIRLEWPDDGLPGAAHQGAAATIAQRTKDAADTRRLLTLVHEFDGRGELVGTSPTSPRNPAKLLGDEPGYPTRDLKGVFGLLRTAERSHLVLRVVVKNAQRKDMEAWRLTPQGVDFIGAPTAQTS